jgi:hypothetical protein
MGDMSDPDELSPQKAAEIRDFLKRWEAAGPVLEEIRYAELRQKSDDDVRNAADNLLSLWKPGLTDDHAEGMVAVQEVFARYRERFMEHRPLR